MIQRLQSIFLALAAGALGGTYALPFADTETAVPETFFADRFFTASDYLPTAILLGLGLLAAVVAIFLYNNRQLQTKVVWASIGATLIGIGAAVFSFMQQAPLLDAVAVDDEPGLFLPGLAVMFGFLANRYIKKDEQLVRSADRLR